MKLILSLIIIITCVISFRCNACEKCLSQLGILGASRDTKNENANVYFYEMGFQEALRQAGIVIYFNHPRPSKSLTDR